MSIWSSIEGDPIFALLNEGAANSRGEGDPQVTVDVATTGHHDLIRLAAWDDNGLDVDLLLTVAAARELTARLLEATGRLDPGGE